jgi:hypothetical protein
MSVKVKHGCHYHCRCLLFDKGRLGIDAGVEVRNGLEEAMVTESQGFIMIRACMQRWFLERPR